MKIDPVEIEMQSLMIAEIRGDISDDAKAHLDKLLSENAEARHLYEDMRTILSSPEGIRAQNELDSNVNVANLMTASAPKRKLVPRMVGLAVAAMLLLILGIYTASWLLTRSDSPQ